MNTLKLTELIEASKKSISNNSGAKALRTKESDKAAEKTMKHLLLLLTGHRKWVNWAGTLGESILGDEAEGKETVPSGLHISKILINENIITHYRNKEDGEYYLAPVEIKEKIVRRYKRCLLYTSPSPRDS